MTSVDVKAEAEMSLSAGITFAGELLFSLGALVATSKVIGRPLRPRPPPPCLGWRLILYITATSVVDVQVLADRSLHAQLDGAVIWPCESLMKLLFCPGTRRGDDQSIDDTGRSAPKGVLKQRESAK